MTRRRFIYSEGQGQLAYDAVVAAEAWRHLDSCQFKTFL